MPSWTSAGAATVEVMMYAGMDGRPMPRIMQVTMENTSVKSRLF